MNESPSGGFLWAELCQEVEVFAQVLVPFPAEVNSSGVVHQTASAPQTTFAEPRCGELGCLPFVFFPQLLCSEMIRNLDPWQVLHW